jgi:hypothetical protein
VPVEVWADMLRSESHSWEFYCGILVWDFMILRWEENFGF